MSDYIQTSSDVRSRMHRGVRGHAGSLRGASTRLLGGLAALLGCLALLPAGATAFDHPFIGKFTTATKIASTVPSNGDLNPYGIVTVQSNSGSLERGSILVSNFNNKGNEQGTGSTIVQVAPGGNVSLFAEIKPSEVPACTGGVGLTTALAILPGGDVVVGSLPTETGTPEAGCLIVLSNKGKLVETIEGGQINGPWDLTSVESGDGATLFVSNVLNGTVKGSGAVVDEGTVVRIHLKIDGHHPPKVESETVIGTEFPERTDPEALVVGPTGVGLSEEDGTLYVADTAGNRVAAIPNAMSRKSPVGKGGVTVAKGGFLNGPLGLTIAPNGDIVTANAGDGNFVETTPVGAEFQPFETEAGAGGLFGLTLAPRHSGIYFVNDAQNTLEIIH